VWTVEQLKLIVDSVPKTHRSLFQCAMLTGARLGKLLGLQWKHIGLDTQTLEIRQALWEGELVTPNTDGSVRVIYFGPSLLSGLMAQKHNSNPNGPEDFVFCKEDGSTLNPDVLRRALSNVGSSWDRPQPRGGWVPNLSSLCGDHRQPRNWKLKTRSEVA
jgi:integrase